MIVLTADEASKVRGRSPGDSSRALYPVPLKDGRYMLGEEVLDDPAHEDVREFLAGLPTVDISDLPIYTEADEQPEAMEIATLTARTAEQKAARDAAIALKARSGKR